MIKRFLIECKVAIAILLTVWVEKVQEITYHGMRSEGCLPPIICGGLESALQDEFFKPLWNSIYKNWDDNPWVWACEFEVIKS